MSIILLANLIAQDIESLKQGAVPSLENLTISMESIIFWPASKVFALMIA
jgi:hypothetical protein